MSPDVIAWSIVGLTFLAIFTLMARAWYVERMTESFELGMKMGRAIGSQGQGWIDEQLLLAGLNPDELPGRING